MDDYKQWQKDFGIRLRAQREKMDLTRQELAELAGTEHGYIVQIERGDRSPSLRMFISILAALGVSSDDLIYGKKEDAEPDSIVGNITEFMTRKKPEDAKALFEIVRLVSKYRSDAEFGVELA